MRPVWLQMTRPGIRSRYPISGLKWFFVWVKIGGIREARTRGERDPLQLTILWADGDDFVCVDYNII